jgi:replication-associated recombination protein RarA
MELVEGLTRISSGRVIGIDRIREVQRFLSIRSDDGGYRFIIIDGAEYMNEEASNAFLKISEDTPPSSMIILTSVQPLLIKETIRSRCRSYRFVRLNEEVFQKICLDRFGYTPEGREYGKERSKTAGKYLVNIMDIRNKPSRLIETVEEIVSNEHEIDFLDYLAGLLRAGVADASQLSMKGIEELEQLYERIEFLKNAILYSHINPQIAIFDFILNNYRKILHYIIKLNPCFKKEVKEGI